MSEQPLMPFSPPAGLEMLDSGDGEAGFCVDGVCSVPPAEDQDEPET